jgi:hypothetical protein
VEPDPIIADLTGCQLANGIVLAFRQTLDEAQEAMELGGLVVDIAAIIAGQLAKIFSGQISFGMTWQAVLALYDIGTGNFDEAFDDYVFQALLCSVFNCLAYDGQGLPYIDSTALICLVDALQDAKQGATPHQQAGIDVLGWLVQLAKPEGLSNLGTAYGVDVPPGTCSPCLTDGAFVGTYSFWFSGLAACGWEEPIYRSDTRSVTNLLGLPPGNYTVDLWFIVGDRANPDPLCDDLTPRGWAVLEKLTGQTWGVIGGTLQGQSPGIHHFQTTSVLLPGDDHRLRFGAIGVPGVVVKGVMAFITPEP